MSGFAGLIIVEQLLTSMLRRSPLRPRIPNSQLQRIAVMLGLQRSMSDAMLLKVHRFKGVRVTILVPLHSLSALTSSQRRQGSSSASELEPELCRLIPGTTLSQSLR